ncbi:MAG: MATE family efflux transporter, partial [Pseudomonadota bacterium]
LQPIVGPVAVWLLGASAAVSESALTYFHIRIWGAPAALVNFALLGWLIGLGRADIAFWLQLLLNLTNIALAILFVLVFSWGVPGVGLAILLAEIITVIVGIGVSWRILKPRNVRVDRRHLFDRRQLGRMLAVNSNIMIRTFCLILAFSMFTRQGAQDGDLTLAINALLFSIAMISAYLLDGFAFAAETFVGRAIGAQRKESYDRALRLTTIWAAVVAIVIALAIYTGGGWMIDLATPKEEVREGAKEMLSFAALVPIVGVWCFQLDGVYIGATQSRDMRNMMLISVAIYLVAVLGLVALLGNMGLWLALYVFFIARAATLYWRLPRVRERAFG